MSPVAELWAGAEAAAGVGAAACGSDHADAGAETVPWCAGQLTGAHQDVVCGPAIAVLVGESGFVDEPFAGVRWGVVVDGAFAGCVVTVIAALADFGQDGVAVAVESGSEDEHLAAYLRWVRGHRQCPGDSLFCVVVGLGVGFAGAPDAGDERRRSFCCIRGCAAGCCLASGGG